MNIDLGGNTIKIELARSARAKWARLEIHLHRGVRVVLPAKAPLADAERLVRSKSAWLLRHLARFERLRRIVPHRKYVTGERLPFLGEELTLEVVKGAAGVERRGSTVVVSLPKPDPKRVRAALAEWYASQADEMMPSRVLEMADKFGIKIKRVRVSRARTRWGTCSPTGMISLNWRLLLGTPGLVDYLVAHELAHVGHPNHSSAFWARVTELCPDGMKEEKWLRKNGLSLTL